MKFEKEEVIRQITGSAKGNKKCAEMLGYSIYTVYSWPNSIGLRRMREIISRMKQKGIEVPKAWEKPVQKFTAIQ